MGNDKHSESRSSSSRRSKEDRHQHKSSSSHSKKSSKHQHKSGRHGDEKRESRIIDDDADEDEVWVEKGDGEAEQVRPDVHRRQRAKADDGIRNIVIAHWRRDTCSTWRITDVYSLLR